VGSFLETRVARWRVPSAGSSAPRHGGRIPSGKQIHPRRAHRRPADTRRTPLTRCHQVAARPVRGPGAQSGDGDQPRASCWSFAAVSPSSAPRPTTTPPLALCLRSLPETPRSSIRCRTEVIQTGQDLRHIGGSLRGCHRPRLRSAISVCPPLRLWGSSASRLGGWATKAGNGRPQRAIGACTHDLRRTSSRQMRTRL